MSNFYTKIDCKAFVSISTTLVADIFFAIFVVVLELILAYYCVSQVGMYHLWASLECDELDICDVSRTKEFIIREMPAEQALSKVQVVCLQCITFRGIW